MRNDDARERIQAALVDLRLSARACDRRVGAFAIAAIHIPCRRTGWRQGA